MATRKLAKKKPRPKAASTDQLGDRSIPVSRLHLHLENPRHEPVESEAEAIAQLCDEEMVTELAKDIAQRGALSPLEVLGVMPMPGNPGHFISLEGNRRTCALIVANDPQRAPAAFREQLKRIPGLDQVPRLVKAHVFKGTSDAKQWIELRHLGLQGGAGTKDWDTTQKQRAAGENVKTSARDNTLAVLVLDRLVARGLLSAEDRRRVSVTTLTRYLGSPGVRAIVGLGSAKDLIYTHEVDEVDQALLHLVLDSLNPQADGTYAVHSRSDAKERVQYANDLKATGHAPSTPLAKATPAPEPTLMRSAGAEAKKPTASKRSANHPDTRKFLIPTDFKVALKDPVLLHLRKEGTELELERFSFSGNYLLRAFVEQIMTLFAKKNGRHNAGMSDSKLTQACADLLRTKGLTGKVVTNVEKAAGDQNTGHGLHSLGHAVHGGTIPTPIDLKRHFDTWRPSLEAMLNDLAQPKN
ncbi:hypothetical protein [Luteibacter sp. 22Crub2.1]|uniref:hypothetical protein n=1 Tax=Luteibacter sp. 22Crub2.1 TaxID=1283288 RepID=UPI0009A76118|nr:hypothetical protein [Luteibacter sp. 22Crub2.1]SKB27878.1 hypothetical protein SAMN05660880_00300 [Luteibacter sp. 22Crub2.1]